MAECERLENLTRSGTREQIEECIQRVAQLFEVIAPTLRDYLNNHSA
jgi:hypothetical protein